MFWVTFSAPHYTLLEQYRIIQALAKVGYNINTRYTHYGFDGGFTDMSDVR